MRFRTLLVILVVLTVLAMGCERRVFTVTPPPTTCPSMPPDAACL